MSIDPYNERVRALFAEPLHCGDIEGAATGYFEDRGLRIRLSAEVAGGRIVRLAFRVWGCPHLIAAAEEFCRRFEGRAPAELEGFESAQIIDDLAVPVEKTGRILALEDTVRSLGQAIQDRLSTEQE